MILYMDITSRILMNPSKIVLLMGREISLGIVHRLCSGETRCTHEVGHFYTEHTQIMVYSQIQLAL